MRKFLVFLTLAFYSNIGLAADLQSCNMDSVQPILEEGIRNALSAVFQIDGQTLDINQIRIARGQDIVIDTGTKTYSYEGLDVALVSPRGTSMSLLSFNDHYGTFYPSLGFNFRVEKTRDSEGFLIKKTCFVDYFIKAEVGYVQPSVRNNINGVRAPISDNFSEFLDNKPVGDLLKFSFPMDLVE